MTRRYKARRKFHKTPEPEGKEGKRSRAKKPTFVIQQHRATSMHYDFRLEVGGVLKSWAVPKGLSTDPREKRLAILTEDHPLDYADFEGVIAEGEYGAGPVLIWDRGSFENVSQKDGNHVDLADALKEGHAVVRLKGEKLEGGYALQRLEDGNENQWLIVKTKDSAADARRRPTSTQPESVKSGRTLEEIEAQDGETDANDR